MVQEISNEFIHNKIFSLETRLRNLAERLYAKDYLSRVWVFCTHISREMNQSCFLSISFDFCTLICFSWMKDSTVSYILYIRKTFCLMFLFCKSTWLDVFSIFLQALYFSQKQKWGRVFFIGEKNMKNLAHLRIDNSNFLTWQISSNFWGTWARF